MAYLIGLSPFIIPALVAGLSFFIFYRHFNDLNRKFLVLFLNTLIIFLVIIISYFLIPDLNDMLFKDRFQYLGLLGAVERLILFGFIYFIFFELLVSKLLKFKEKFIKILYFITNYLLLFLSWELVQFLI